MRQMRYALEPAPRLSLFHEADVEAAALRVVASSRRQLDRIAGYDSASETLSRQNPYVQSFVSLYRYARGLEPYHAGIATRLDVADTVLGNPLYAGPEGEIENPLLLLVVTGVRLRMRKEAGGSLSAEEQSLIE